MSDSTPPAEPPKQSTVQKNCQQVVVPFPWKYPAIGIGFLCVVGVLVYFAVTQTPRSEPPPAATLTVEPATSPLLTSSKKLDCGIAQAEDCSRVSLEVFNGWNDKTLQPGAR